MWFWTWGGLQRPPLWSCKEHCHQEESSAFRTSTTVPPSWVHAVVTRWARPDDRPSEDLRLKLHPWSCNIKHIAVWTGCWKGAILLCFYIPLLATPVGICLNGLAPSQTSAGGKLDKTSSLVFVGYSLCCLSQCNLFLSVRKAYLVSAGLHSLHVRTCWMHSVLLALRSAALSGNLDLHQEVFKWLICRSVWPTEKLKYSNLCEEWGSLSAVTCCTHIRDGWWRRNTGSSLEIKRQTKSTQFN